MPIESPTGLLIACSDGNLPFTVRVLDGQDVILLSEDVTPSAPSMGGDAETAGW